jgi:hypothetical protein
MIICRDSKTDPFSLSSTGEAQRTRKAGAIIITFSFGISSEVWRERISEARNGPTQNNKILSRLPKY